MSTKGSKRTQEVNSLKKIGFSLCVSTVDAQKRNIERKVERIEVPKTFCGQPCEFQSRRIGMTTKNALSSSGSRTMHGDKG